MFVGRRVGQTGGGEGARGAAGNTSLGCAARLPPCHTAHLAPPCVQPAQIWDAGPHTLGLSPSRVHATHPAWPHNTLAPPGMLVFTPSVSVHPGCMAKARVRAPAAAHRSLNRSVIATCGAAVRGGASGSGSALVSSRACLWAGCTAPNRRSRQQALPSHPGSLNHPHHHVYCHQ